MFFLQNHTESWTDVVELFVVELLHKKGGEVDCSSRAVRKDTVVKVFPGQPKASLPADVACKFTCSDQSVTTHI